MGTMSVWHWLILLAVVLLFFGGKGKISSVMGDVAEGIKSFKKGMKDDDSKPSEPGKTSEPPKPLESQTIAAPKAVDPSAQGASSTKVG